MDSWGFVSKCGLCRPLRITGTKCAFSPRLEIRRQQDAKDADELVTPIELHCAVSAGQRNQFREERALTWKLTQDALQSCAYGDAGLLADFLTVAASFLAAMRRCASDTSGMQTLACFPFVAFSA